MIEFCGKFDARLSRRTITRQIQKMWWLYLIFSLLFVIVGVLAIIMPEDSSDLTFGVVMIVFGLLFSPFCILLSIAIQKGLDRSMSILSDNTLQTFQFYPDKFVISMAKGDDYQSVTRAKYSYLFRVEETKDCYFLRISRTQTHVVKKSDLTQGTLAELNSILQAALGAKFKPCAAVK